MKNVLILFCFAIIPNFCLAQVDTIYVNFNQKKTSIQGEFDNTIAYKAHASITNLYEIQYKCFFNRIEVDSTATFEEEANNLGAYIRTQFFYFSYLINSVKDDNKDFVNYLSTLKDRDERFSDFDLKSIIPKDKIDKMTKDEMYLLLKRKFDSIDKKVKWDAYSRVIKGRSLELIYHKNFKNYTQKIIDKSQLNVSNFIDFTKPIETTDNYVMLFKKLDEADVIFLTTTLNENDAFVLFKEVYFNKQYVKPY
jgi:hypothetical protein